MSTLLKHVSPPHLPRVLRDPQSGAEREYMVICWCGWDTRGQRPVALAVAALHAKKGIVKGQTYSATSNA